MLGHFYWKLLACFLVIDPVLRTKKRTFLRRFQVELQQAAPNAVNLSEVTLAIVGEACGSCGRMSSGHVTTVARLVQDGPKGPDRKEVAAWRKSAIVRDFHVTSSLLEKLERPFLRWTPEKHPKTFKNHNLDRCCRDPMFGFGLRQSSRAMQCHAVPT